MKTKSVYSVTGPTKAQLSHGQSGVMLLERLVVILLNIFCVSYVMYEELAMFHAWTCNDVGVIFFGDNASWKLIKVMWSQGKVHIALYLHLMSYNGWCSPLK